MRVLTAKAPPAHKMRGGQPTPKPVANPYTFPAPTNGLVLNENLSNPVPASARQLDNFVVTMTGIRARGGAVLYATLDSAVISTFTYKSGSTEKFFAASAGSVYDITAPADPAVPPTATLTGKSAGYYVTEQFGTAGGDYLYALNGVDEPLLYDGSTFTAITGVSSPAITGVTTTDLSHVWSYANRLFFVQKDTMLAWYLPVDSIGGAASSFSLAGIFKKGGSLLFGATWSLDAGDGLDDKCVFISTEGEIAVYSGTNPGSAADWAKQGVYQITRPLGPKAIMQAGGDLLIATETGLVPLSEAIRRDVAALSVGAVSRRIEPYWQPRARDYSASNWEILKWPQKNLMIVSQPGGDDTCLVANLQSGAWSRFVGWDTQCLGFYNGNGYFGTTGAEVYLMESSGLDGTAQFTCVYLGQHDPMGAPGMQKTVHQMRPIFQVGSPINPQLKVLTNFTEENSAPPSAATYGGTEGWDIGLWDSAIWDGTVTSFGLGAGDSRWVAIGRTGHTIAPELQMTFGGAGTPDVELVSIDATYSVGALVA